VKCKEVRFWGGYAPPNSDPRSWARPHAGPLTPDSPPWARRYMSTQSSRPSSFIYFGGVVFLAGLCLLA
jgi:hypothetical protein